MYVVKAGYLQVGKRNLEGFLLALKICAKVYAKAALPWARVGTGQDRRPTQLPMSYLMETMHRAGAQRKIQISLGLSPSFALDP